MLRKILCFFGFHDYEMRDFMTTEGLMTDPVSEIFKEPYMKCRECGKRW